MDSNNFIWLLIAGIFIVILFLAGSYFFLPKTYSAYFNNIGSEIATESDARFYSTEEQQRVSSRYIDPQSDQVDLNRYYDDTKDVIDKKDLLANNYYTTIVNQTLDGNGSFDSNLVKFVYDDNNVAVVSGIEKELKTGASVPSLNWGNLQAFDPSGSVVSLDWGLRNLNDDNGDVALDWSVRNLVGDWTINDTSLDLTNYVPYIGAVQNLQMGNFDSNVRRAYFRRGVVDGTDPKIDFYTLESNDSEINFFGHDLTLEIPDVSFSFIYDTNIFNFFGLLSTTVFKFAYNSGTAFQISNSLVQSFKPFIGSSGLFLNDGVGFTQTSEGTELNDLDGNIFYAKGGSGGNFDVIPFLFAHEGLTSPSVGTGIITDYETQSYDFATFDTDHWDVNNTGDINANRFCFTGGACATSWTTGGGGGVDDLNWKFDLNVYNKLLYSSNMDVTNINGNIGADFNRIGGYNETGGYWFDNNLDYIKADGISGFLVGVRGLTYSAWIKRNALADDAYIFSTGTNNYDDISFYIDKISSSYYLGARFNNTGGDDYSRRTVATIDGNWHHVASTFDGNLLRLYVDGIEEATVFTGNSIDENRLFESLSQSPTKFTIGRLRNLDSANSFGGYIDNPMVWSRALNETEIALLATYIPKDYVAGNYDLTETSGASAYLSADQTINTASWTRVAYNVERWDTLGEFDTTTLVGRFTALTAGTYVVTAATHWLNGDSGVNYLTGITQTGNFVAIAGGNYAASESIKRQSVSATLKLVAGEYIEIKVYQGSGGNETLQGDFAYDSHVGIVKVG